MSKLADVQAALLGSPSPTSAGDRVAIDQSNDIDTYPRAVLHRFRVIRVRGIDNTLLAIQEIIHIECWGEDRVQALQLEDEVVAALDAAGYIVDDSEPDGFEPTQDVRCADLTLSAWTTPDILSVETVEP